MVLAAVALLAGAAAHVQAQEKTGAASESDALARAKKEFDALRAARESALQPTPDLPRVDMPKWHGPATTAPTPGVGIGAGSAGAGKSLKKPAGKNETRSATWLIDAMEKERVRERDGRAQPGERGAGPREREREPDRANEARAFGGGLSGSRAGEGSEAREREGEETLALDKFASSSTEESASRSSERADENAREKPVEAPNPLSAFLGDWMTPQDYALLKSGLSGPSAGGASAGANSSAAAAGNSSSRAAVAPGSGSSGDSLLGSLAGLGSRGSGGFSPTKPNDNPYLSTLGATADSAPHIFAKPDFDFALPPPAALPLPPPMLRTETSPLLSPNVSPANAPSPTKIPDFAKPNHDEKYFRQLKRF